MPSNDLPFQIADGRNNTCKLNWRARDKISQIDRSLADKVKGLIENLKFVNFCSMRFMPCEAEVIVHFVTDLQPEHKKQMIESIRMIALYHLTDRLR